jgi:hypothetical protein
MIAGLVLGAAGSATAQPAAPPVVAPVPTDAEVGFERRPRLSPQEELTQADAVLARIDAAVATVRRQLETARQARDVVKTLCLNDKMSQTDVANRSARDRQAALQSAVLRNDAELANHEFAILTVLRQRVEQLTAEANQCIGEEMAFIGQTSIVTTIDPNLPGDDNTLNPSTDPTPVTEPPACSSMCVP